MIKYIWIAMLVIVDLLWAFSTIRDFVVTAKHFRKPWNHLEDSSVGFICVHLFTLFFFSFFTFIGL